MQHKVCGLQFGSAGTTLAAEGKRRAASPLGACHLAQTPRAETQGFGGLGQGAAAGGGPTREPLQCTPMGFYVFYILVNKFL